MVRLFYISTAILLLLFCQKLNANTYCLFNNGYSSYTIILSENASPSERLAANELQCFLKELGGVRIPIKSEKNGESGAKIIVGYSKIAKKCYPYLERPDDSDQSFRYFNKGGDIIIIGGAKIGTLYGVYSFLENEFGCRWLTNKVSFIQKKQSWTFTSLDFSSSPAFKYRYLYSNGTLDKLWSLRNCNNGRPNKFHTELRDIQDCPFPFWGVHTFDRFVQSEQYFEDHPEYYSLINGNRAPKQLCLTNKKVEELCINGLRAIIKGNPEFSVYDLSQNDNESTCQCNNCKRIKKKYGSESGLIIWFVNKIAKKLKKEFPNKYIGTLAYLYSQKPPVSVLPDNNVVIRLCVINSCLIHDLESCQRNKSTGRDVEEWSKLTQNLYVWDYISTTRLYYAPMPNFEAIQLRLKYYKEKGVKGVLLEGNTETEYGEFSALRNYVVAKLLWNPYANLDHLVSDFITHYYGNAASLIRDYYNLTQKRAKITHYHIPFLTDHKNGIYSEDYLERAYELLSQAGVEADNQIIRDRVYSEKLSVAFMLCKVDPQKGIQKGAYDFVKRFAHKKNIKKFAGYGENVDPNAFYEEIQVYKK